MIRLDQVENYTGIVVMNPRLVEEIQADEEALAREAITAHKMVVLPVTEVEKIWEPHLHPRDLNGKFIKALGRKKKFEFFEVGGAVRDGVLGVPTKDVDFSVVASDNTGTAEERFKEMVDHLTNQGFEIFVSNPEFLTVRAKVPKKHKLASRTDVADFVLARADGPSTDGRRPDWVLPGTLLDDLSRRDFTVNAMARASDGSIVDPFGGQADLQSMTLRFVGEPMDRIREDGLRTVRAFRFAVTKGMTIESRTWDAITSKEAADKLASVSKERMRDELEKMLREDTLGTMSLLAKLPDWTVKAMFPNGLRLSATLKKSSAVEIKERKWTDDLGGMSENSETSPEQPVLSPIATELQKLWQDGFAAGMADPMIKLVKAEVDQNDIIDEATAYARKSAGEMVEGVKNTRPIQSLISRSIDEEWTDARLQKALSRIVGLDTRSQVALDNLEKKLTKDGLPVGKRNKQVDAYSKTLKARRVKVIADNERASAFAEGKRAAWRRMKSMDEISPYAVRIWRTHKDEKTCSVCGPLNGRRAGIDDNRGYRTGSANKPTGFTLGPPAHVNCRCWEELTDRGTPKVP